MQLQPAKKAIRVVRRIFQIFFLGGAFFLAAKLLLGVPTRTVEYYCPMGGIVSFYGLFKKQQFICALGEMNLSLALALLATVLITKRSFCSWVCPLGTIFEGLSALRRRIIPESHLRLSNRTDAVLCNLKYIVLAAILILTYRAGELVFRGYDPFYVLFTGGKGHDLIPIVSLAVLGAILVASFLFEFAWCRYLCPLAAVMNPLSRLGLLKVRRDRTGCDACGACDTVCPQRIRVSEAHKITSVDCTNCFECLTHCPRPRVLEVSV